MQLYTMKAVDYKTIIHLKKKSTIMDGFLYGIVFFILFFFLQNSKMHWNASNKKTKQAWKWRQVTTLNFIVNGCKIISFLYNPILLTITTAQIIFTTHFDYIISWLPIVA